MTGGLKKIMFFILTIALAYVAFAYMIRPANLDLINQKEKVQQKAAKLDELEKATLTADDLNKQLERVEQAIKAFENKLPPKSEIHTVLQNVTLIAQKNGLTPKTFRALKRKESNGYVEQPLKIELNGNFNSYYSFLLELERMDRITKIKELSLKKNTRHEGQTSASFIMSIFFQDRNV